MDNQFPYWIIMIVFVFSGCSKGVDLRPADNRPVRSLTIGDATEAALVEQELRVEIKYVEDNTMYFYADNENTLAELSEIGYKINEVSPMQTNFRMLKLVSYNSQNLTRERDEEVQKELQTFGIKVINREDGYWAIYGNLENLTYIRDRGFLLKNLDNEPRPRSVEIMVDSRDDIQRVNEFDVDIHSSERTETGMIVYGAAFDYQIDQLEAAGFTVTRRSN